MRLGIITLMIDYCNLNSEIPGTILVLYTANDL